MVVQDEISRLRGIIDSKNESEALDAIFSDRTPKGVDVGVAEFILNEVESSFRALKDGDEIVDLRVVGSAWLGFSVADTKRFRKFDDEKSDIDVAIIDADLFQIIWEKLYLFSQQKFWDNVQRREFEKYLFRGWIRPDKLPPGFRVGRVWWKEVNAISKRTHKIVRVGLYQNDFFFRQYYGRGIMLAYL